MIVVEYIENKKEIYKGREFESHWLHTKKREIKMSHLFSLTVIDVISAVKIYHVQGTITNTWDRFGSLA